MSIIPNLGKLSSPSLVHVVLGVTLACSGFGCGSSPLTKDGGDGGAGKSTTGEGGSGGSSGGASGKGGGTGGSTGGPSGGIGGSTGGQGGGNGGHAGVGGVPEHRPQALACEASFGATQLAGDAGTTSCTSDGDCQTPDGGAFNLRFCRQHSCTSDQCLTDGDCAATEVCGCANQFGGNAIHTNRCIPTSCHTDADCGAAGLCSPAHNSYCGSLTGYHCRTAADTCHVNGDCPSHNDSGISVPWSCSYEPTIGHWQCAPTAICAG